MLTGNGIGRLESLANVKSHAHKNVDQHYVCRKFDAKNPIIIEVNTSGCAGQENEVNFLEHVQAFVTVSATRRGTTHIP